MAVLITGGAGYIGSHTAIELLDKGYDVVLLDNFHNSSMEAVRRIEKITQKHPPFELVDITNFPALCQVFQKHKIDSVIHFAALKAVGESSEVPLDYWRVNVGGAISLLRAMQDNDVRKFVFSSSATVYGDATRFENMIPIPGIDQSCSESPIFKGTVLRDHANANPDWNIAILRYFNPGGAHGQLGEDPRGVPNNLLPYLAQGVIATNKVEETLTLTVAIGRRDYLPVLGNDYDSVDGTPIRDYVHIVDLALGHISALEHMKMNNAGCREWNLGTGCGSTVLQVLDAFSRAVGRTLPSQVKPRRPGDVLNLTANPSRANRELQWKAEKSLDQMCLDLWNFQQKNPDGLTTQNEIK